MLLNHALFVHSDYTLRVCRIMYRRQSASCNLDLWFATISMFKQVFASFDLLLFPTKAQQSIQNLLDRNDCFVKEILEFTQTDVGLC